MFERRIVIDARGHLLGRLAALVAKEVLNGQRVVIVRTEELNISGSHYRNKLKYHEFLRKRCLVNPSHGPLHLRSPSKIFWRTVRGMVPHKTPRGANALSKLKVFEGVPPPYDKIKRVVAPEALRLLRLRPGRKYTTLGRLSTEVGWKYKDTITTLEAKRKLRAKTFYERKKVLNKLRTKALSNISAKVNAISPLLAQIGRASCRERV